MASNDESSMNQLKYDRCAYEKTTYESVHPLEHQIYAGKYEHCDKCVHDGVHWRPFDTQIVDAESELKGLTRRTSKCGQYQYSPLCDTSAQCTSTYKLPVVLNPEVCPPVQHNIPQINGPGYALNNASQCNNQMRLN